MSEDTNALFDSARGALEPSREDVDRNYRGVLTKLAAVGAGAAASTIAGSAAGKGLGGTVAAAGAKGALVKGGIALTVAKWLVPVVILGSGAALAPKAMELRSGAVRREVARASSPRGVGLARGIDAATSRIASVQEGVASEVSGDARGVRQEPIAASDLPSARAERGSARRTDPQKVSGDPPVVATTEPATEPQATDEPIFDGAKAVRVTPALAPELGLVQRMAKAQPSGRNGEALALAREHEGRYPNGVFREEREAVRALATCAEGDEAKAGTLARFQRSFPSSPLLTRVKKACSP